VLRVGAAVAAPHLDEDVRAHDAGYSPADELGPADAGDYFDGDGVACLECCELLGAEPVLDCHAPHPFPMCR
jgi:hypothetical protein